MNPHIWRMLYGGLTPGLARGKLKFDPTSAAMTVGGGYVGDKLFKPSVAGPVQGPPTIDQVNPLAKFTSPGAGGRPLTQTAGNIYKAAGNFNVATEPNVITGYEPSWFSRNVSQPIGQGIDYARDIAATEIPGAQTLKDIGQTDVGLTSLNELNPFGDKYNPFSSDMLFPDAAPNIGRAVAGATAGYDGSGIYDEQAEAEQAYKDWLAQQELEAERREMPTREWLARLEDDPLQYRHTYRGPLSLEELIRRAREGIDSAEEGRQFEDIAWDTPSGRESGEFELGARYGGYLPEVKRWFGGRGVAIPQKGSGSDLFSVARIFPKSGRGGCLGGGIAELLQRPEVKELLLGDKPVAPKVPKELRVIPDSPPHLIVEPEGEGPWLEKIYDEGTIARKPQPIEHRLSGVVPSQETAGLYRIPEDDPFTYKGKGLTSTAERQAVDNNVLLLLEENEKALARQQNSFDFMGQTFRTNPDGRPERIDNQGPTFAMAGGGMPQQFFSGRVPNTVDPRSDGMSDSETMLITDQTGRDPRGLMKISEQEYVVSAPDMALLGNGDPVAGAQHLDEFRQNLRQAAYGTKAHQPRINPNSALQSLAHRAFG